jgi:hypothetical protein
MASPVDDLGDQDAGGEGDAENEERTRPPAALDFGPLPELGPGGSDLTLRGLLVRRGLTFRPGDDQARLQLAQEYGIVRQLLRELRFDPAFRGRPIGELLETVRGPVDELIALAHFLTGGSSPVATRQILEAARLAASVAAAASDA